MSLKTLFILGDPFIMTILTVELILLILAAWKAPAWVKELGLIALTTTILDFLYCFYIAFDAISAAGNISMAVFAGGFKVALIPLMYGVGVYMLSLILRLIQKPRI